MLLLYALARPIFSNTEPSSTGNSTVFDPLTGECDDIHGCRTAPQILWNCLSVIFICTWVAIHPNVPHVEAHRAVVLFCNGMLMAIAMLVPEIIILWAIKQRYSAKEVAEKYKKYGWGMAHGFLVIMGGFAVYDDNKFHGYIWKNGEVERDSNRGNVDSTVRAKIKKRHLQMVTAGLDTRPEEKDEESSVAAETEESRLIAGTGTESADHIESKNLNNNADLLEFLIKHGHITITEDEIMENLSHSDTITKFIAVIQTAWFLLQVGARAVEGLAITELEIITVGFAVLNFGTYFLWWNKPLRVRHPLRVYWRQQNKAEKVLDQNGGPHGWKAKLRGFTVGLWTIFRDAAVAALKSIFAVINFLAFQGMNEEDVNWRVLGFALILLPFLVVFHLIMASIFIITDANDDYMAYVVNSSRLEEESFTLYILVYGLTTLFGAIHCIPWNFQFPTHTEQLLWRISAGGLVVLPVGLGVVFVILFLIGALVDWCGKDSEDFIGFSLVIFDALLLPIAYFVARVILMVLALMELRNLPQSAYQTVQWTTFIPHIG